MGKEGNWQKEKRIAVKDQNQNCSRTCFTTIPNQSQETPQKSSLNSYFQLLCYGKEMLEKMKP
jgi:hypothetical protein